MKRSKIGLSHYKLLTCNMGQIIPIAWYEALPGDTIQQATSMLVRVSPLVAPVMHPVRIRIHHWFVPNRLIWEDWENFITGGDGYTEYSHPRFSRGTVTQGSLWDFLGIPPGSYSPNLEISALPVRAYQLIYNEHYRDQDLVTEVPVSVESGIEGQGTVTTSQDLQRCAWEKDYFTTARPWEQKGPEVTIPIGDRAPIIGIGKTNQTYATADKTVFETDAQATTVYPESDIADATGEFWIRGSAATGGLPQIYADLSQATGISVNELRESLALQRFMEARAQYGSRYVEYLRYLGVRSSDARLQNPEYLGGGKNIISFSEVLQTQRTDADQTPLGTMGGHGIAAMRSNRFRRFFEEHGIVMTLMSVVPKAIYTSAVHRKWHRLDNMLYFQKELQFLGDQPITAGEVNAAQTDRTEIFGYVPRYDDYRYHPSEVSGEFRNELDYWHYARQFTGDVALNQSFIEANPTKRVNADQNGDCLYVMANHSIQARRMMSKNPSPRTF